jgi:hypothetical protein
MASVRVTTLFFTFVITFALGGAAMAQTPVVIELFTSEGCSSCPPADDLLQRLVDASMAGVQVVALGEHVDYWDHQGWKDRFSSAAFTNRQQMYAARFNVDSIYTPQMVVDGRAEVVGSDAAGARAAIARAAQAPHGKVEIQFDGRRVDVAVASLPSMSRGDRADILIAITEDGLRSDVKRGENHGRVLSHAAVVRQLTTIGEANGESAAAHVDVALAPGWQRDRLKLVAFVQERRGRAIVAAAAVPIAAAR